MKVELAEDEACKVVVDELQWSIENGDLEPYALTAFHTVLEYFMPIREYVEWLRRNHD